MESISNILKTKGFVTDHRNKYEFQAYGNMLAEELKDPKHRTLYFKLAKEKDRKLLETALAFALDNAKDSGLAKAFMWKLAEISKKDSGMFS
ncbi:TPA: hypothetical protein DCY43_02335 [candidate division WWE3 bacterium]|uniref:Uncharacterized protein n=1 Tax=candidate division WWE3 bacterium TaxID=2053526 RepID=A0A351JTE6_UNCKA|nr:hypothetical protein [candidate division WWE3 bacterium]